MKSLVLSLIIFLALVNLTAQSDLVGEFPLNAEVKSAGKNMIMTMVTLEGGSYFIVKEDISKKLPPGLKIVLDQNSEGEIFLSLPGEDNRYAVMQFMSSANNYGYGNSEGYKQLKAEKEKREAQIQVLKDEANTLQGGFNVLTGFTQEDLDYDGPGFYNYALRQKLTSLESAKEMNKVTYGARERNKEYLKAEQNISSGYESTDVKEAEDQVEADMQAYVELTKKELGLSIKPHLKPWEMMSFEWQDIQKALAPNSVAIEYVKIRFYQDEWVEDYHYYGTVLRKDSDEPKLVYLGMANEIEPLMAKLNDRNGAKFYDRGSVDPENSTAARLYNFCWAPVEPLVQGVENVYFSPAGVLGRVSFDALNGPNGHPLILTTKMHHLGSTRDLLVERKQADLLPPSDGCWLLAGGIDYNLTPNRPIDAKVNPCDIVFGEPYEEKTPFNPSTMLKPLPQTLSEVNTIGALLDDKGVTHRILTGRDANEEAFRFLGYDTKSPTVIHIATHGFSHFERNDSGEKVADKSLENSGVYFAGSQLWYRNDGLKLNGRWTTDELSKQDLTNTQLVVLSACNSGKGLTALREGVYGIQRGLKMAGVQNLIVALWPVNDGAAAYFMTSFYEEWLSGISVHEAFTRAKVGMMKNPKYASPYHWAVFQLIE